jgi:hypothetical protein
VRRLCFAALTDQPFPVFRSVKGFRQPSYSAVQGFRRGCGRGCRLIDEACPGRSSTDSFLLLELEISELKNQVLQRFGLGLWRSNRIGEESFSECGQDLVHRRLDTTSTTAYGDIGHFPVEVLFKYPKFGAIQREWDDGKVLLAALLLQLERET